MSSQVFIMKFDFRYAYADITESLNGADSLDLSADNSEMFRNFKFGWLTTESTQIPTCAIIISELFCIDKDKCVGIPFDFSLAPITIGRTPYMVLTNVEYLDNCLNIKKSKIKRFSNGDIMEVTSPVLLPKEYPILFRIPEMPSVFFCTSIFKEFIENNSITGVIFEECPVKSKSWF